MSIEDENATLEDGGQKLIVTDDDPKSLHEQWFPQPKEMPTPPPARVINEDALFPSGENVFDNAVDWLTSLNKQQKIDLGMWSVWSVSGLLGLIGLSFGENLYTFITVIMFLTTTLMTILMAFRDDLANEIQPIGREAWEKMMTIYRENKVLPENIVYAFFAANIAITATAGWYWLATWFIFMLFYTFSKRSDFKKTKENVDANTGE